MKSAVFVLIIVLGYTLKKIKFFKTSDFSLISKIVLNITLPCAVISNFSKLSIETSFIVLVIIGVICNLVMIGVGYLVSLKRNRDEKAFNMINFSGYSIGSFTMPFVQSFLGPVGIVATCLFDAGNAFLCTGGTYSLASAVIKDEEKMDLKAFFRKTFSSVPLNAYLIMLLISILGIRLPNVLIMFTDTVGSSNGFLAMLMIWIGFELELESGQITDISKFLILRYGIAAIFAMLFYFVLPLDIEIRKALVIIAFAPVSAVCTIFTEKCGGDVTLSSTINSISILIGIFSTTIIMLII